MIKIWRTNIQVYMAVKIYLIIKEWSFKVVRLYLHIFTSQETIYFKPQYVIKCAPVRNYSDYETPAFAFYYPEGSDCSAIVSSEDFITKTIRLHECKKTCEEKKNYANFIAPRVAIYTLDSTII